MLHFFYIQLDQIFILMRCMFKAKTPEQWETSDKTVTTSPACRGGFGK